MLTYNAISENLISFYMEGKTLFEKVDQICGDPFPKVLETDSRNLGLLYLKEISVPQPIEVDNQKCSPNLIFGFNVAHKKWSDIQQIIFKETKIDKNHLDGDIVRSNQAQSLTELWFLKKIK